MSKSSITLHLTDLTPGQATAAIAALGGVSAAPANPTTTAMPSAPQTAAMAMPSASNAPAVAAAAAPTPSAYANPAPHPAATGQQFTLEQVVAAVTKFAKTPSTGGAGKLREILTEFGVTKATDLKPEQYAAILARVAV